ncbi:hypothetical protein FT643_18500 [Ketobacter sp. MCCC 1A13808]|nr:hypothetical protein [Ketobacter sp. MCCC 1A13808]RLP55155.1 MAG: hypothetical protein D6160_07965 [Ketobacter sp.]
MPIRLAALIVEDEGRYPDTRIREIHQRVGLEIPRSRVRCRATCDIKGERQRPHSGCGRIRHSHRLARGRGKKNLTTSYLFTQISRSGSYRLYSVSRFTHQSNHTFILL